MHGNATEDIIFDNLSAGPPCRICVTVRGRDFPGSCLNPPRRVIPKVPLTSRFSTTTIRLHKTENDICSEIQMRNLHVLGV